VVTVPGAEAPSQAQAHGARLVDGLALAALLLAGLLAWGPLDLRWLRDGVIYVSPEGADWHIGRSPHSAVRTLQRAADMAVAGDTVLILPGVYAEDLRIRRGGAPGKPVMFRAQQPGTVTLTGAADARALGPLAWRDEGNGIRSAIVPWPVHRVHLEEAALFHAAWGGVAGLRKLTALPGAWGAFIYEPESRRLFVFLPGTQWAQAGDFVIHRAIPSPREWGNIRAANAWVEAAHVVFEGLRFDFGVGAGLLLWNAADVLVRDCSFSGVDIGVGAHPRIGGAVDVRVEHSLYHNYPQYHWQNGWLPWREVYARYASSSLVAMGGRGVQVLGNLVSNGGDSVRVSPEAGTGPWGAIVEGNLFYRGTDDAVEAEGDVHGVLVRGNIVYDHHQNLGLSPVWRGPVLVEGNRFLHPVDGINGSQVKLLNAPTAAQPKPPPIRNITLRHNVFVGRYLVFANEPVVDVRVEDNLFALQEPGMTHWPAGAQVHDTRISQWPVPGDLPPGADPRWWQAGGLGGAPRLPRPGPRWLDWAMHPATRNIVAAIPQAGWRDLPQ
jgi:hypothetical protein